MDRLRTGVENAILKLGTEFLKEQMNTQLRDALKTGSLDDQEYYNQLVCLVYRFLFLLIAEDRDLLFYPLSSNLKKKKYWDVYSIRRLQNLLFKTSPSEGYHLWKRFTDSMDKLYHGCDELALPPLDTFLWEPTSCDWLIRSECSNQGFLDALRFLICRDDNEHVLTMNWKTIGMHELGSIYESLLEFSPYINQEHTRFELRTHVGNKRKVTGSYYTPDPLVERLLKSTLDPVIHQALYRKPKKEKERSLLEITVCDAACGPGYFLVAAARRLAKRLAQIRSNKRQPPSQILLQSMRDVVSKCIYGVDINPMAVELCKVSLWMEILESGKPLSFLNAQIHCGNALLGTTPALMAKGIPDHAFTHLLGDESSRVKEGEEKETLIKLSKYLSDRNKRERHQMSIFNSLSMEDINQEQNPVNHPLSTNRYDEIKRQHLLADLWCSAFVWPKKNDPLAEEGRDDNTENPIHHEHNSIKYAPTTHLWLHAIKKIDTLPQYTRDKVKELAQQYQFFHWHLAFPQIFRPIPLDDTKDHRGWEGGFSVMLGNPPWERVKVQEKEFFAHRNQSIADAQNASERKRRIECIPKASKLWQQFQRKKRIAEGRSHFIRHSGLFPLCGKGDVNTYAAFTELNRNQLSPLGRAGCIVPRGIAVDTTTKFFFQDLMKTRTLISLYDFTNGTHFPAVGPQINFCLITMAPKETPKKYKAQICFFANQVSEIEKRSFTLTLKEINKINPNTMNCPTFRTVHDAVITKWIYSRVPVLWRKKTDEQSESNPWEIRFKRMFDMANDSHLFRSKIDLETEGWHFDGTRFERNGEFYLPLFEAKLIHHYTHRFATFNHEGTQSRKVKISELQKADSTLLPRYWVPKDEVEKRLQKRGIPRWLLGFRDICRSTDIRTGIFTVLPLSGVGHTLPLIRSSSPLAHLLPAILSSFVFDFSARQGVGGMHLTYGILKQIAIPSPQQIADFPFCNHLLELIYTSWDLQPFAEEFGYYGPPFKWDVERRLHMRCELDAYFFYKYLGSPHEWEKKATRELKMYFSNPRDVVDYIMESFPVVKKRNRQMFGDYKTKQIILEAFDDLQRACSTGQSYQTSLDPLPAHPSMAHPV